MKRYAAPPKEKTTVNYGHLRSKQHETCSKLSVARGGLGQLQQSEHWHAALLESLAKRTAVTLHSGTAKEQATAMAKQPGRAVAYWSLGSKAWRMGRLRGMLNQADVEEEVKRHGADTKTGQERARNYLRGDCVWLEFAEGADVGIVAVPLNAMVAAATCAQKKRTLFFLDVEVDAVIPDSALEAHKRFHLSCLQEGDLQGWAQCERCFAWRKVPDDVYDACTNDGAPFVCGGDAGCKSPFDVDELRFAPLDAPARANKRLARKR